MALDSIPSRHSGHFHAVRFYSDDASLCRIVAQFLGEGFLTGQPAVVIATPSHRKGIVQELETHHFDVEQMQRTGDLLVLDARETLGAFMADGKPDSVSFTSTIGGAIERVCRGRTDCVVRAYGEKVDLLWKDGMHEAAIRVEMLWNQMAGTHAFSLLCGYAMGSFYKDAAFDEICRQHTHVVSVAGEFAPRRAAKGTARALRSKSGSDGRARRFEGERRV